MRQFMMTVMALTAFGAMMATAKADAIHGGPMRSSVGNESPPALGRRRFAS